MAGVKATTKKNAGTAIISCTCKHTFQDKEYGKGNRVGNSCNAGYRCTVCLSVKSK